VAKWAWVSVNIPLNFPEILPLHSLLNPDPNRSFCVSRAPVRLPEKQMRGNCRMWGHWQTATAAVAPMGAPPPQPSVPPPLPDAPPPPPPADGASAGGAPSGQQSAGGGGSGAAAQNDNTTPSAAAAAGAGFNPYSSGQATAGGAGAGNPYEQYTAAQYAAMTPEQQYALQHHWHQWQTYQAEYAKWHAQYGEQVSPIWQSSTPDKQPNPN